MKSGLKVPTKYPMRIFSFGSSECRDEKRTESCVFGGARRLHGTVAVSAAMKSGLKVKKPPVPQAQSK